jgi:hypothetical protein
MVNAYTKMKPDSFKLHLQAVLTTYYEAIKGVQGASGCHKTRRVKCRFEDQEDDTGNEGADAADAAAVPEQRSSQAQRQRRRCGRRQRRGGACSSCTCTGRQGHGVLRRRLLRLMLIELVCLNLNRCDTWQQPDPAYRPASRAKTNCT